MVELRVLGSGDERRLEAFLGAHADSSMILRSNVRAVGVVDRGGPFHGIYAAAVDGDRVVAVAAHMTRGGIVLQAPDHVEVVVRLAVERSGRPVAGLLGPWPQVITARDALGLRNRPTRQMSREILYALVLRDLVVPAMLGSGAVRCRRSEPDDLKLLAEWRAAYNVEANGRPDDAENPIRSRAEIEHWHTTGVSFVLTRDEVPVAYSAFNAHLPDVVQVGGVWTPPPLRGHGYARSVVAGSLLLARTAGARRAVLFTGDENLPAQRAYEALGFRPIGDYGLLFFA
jgi:RimJ/RimL family protein N-acetyltransferase